MGPLIMEHPVELLTEAWFESRFDDIDRRLCQLPKLLKDRFNSTDNDLAEMTHMLPIDFFKRLGPLYTLP